MTARDLNLHGRDYPVTRATAVLFGCLVAAMVAAGAFSELVTPLEGFGMDADLTTHFSLPTALTLVLLVVAAVFAALRGRISPRRERFLWWGLGIAFAYLCLEEAIGIHDRLEPVTGFDPELLYVPLVLAAGVLWFLALRGLEADPVARLMWIGGGALWAVSQEIELLTVGRASLEAPLTLPEEALEMIGTALFALAILRYLESHAAPWVIRVKPTSQRPFPDAA